MGVVHQAGSGRHCGINLCHDGDGISTGVGGQGAGTSGAGAGDGLACSSTAPVGAGGAHIGQASGQQVLDDDGGLGHTGAKVAGHQAVGHVAAHDVGAAGGDGLGYGQVDGRRRRIIGVGDCRAASSPGRLRIAHIAPPATYAYARERGAIYIEISTTWGTQCSQCCIEIRGQYFLISEKGTHVGGAGCQSLQSGIGGDREIRGMIEQLMDCTQGTAEADV